MKKFLLLISSLFCMSSFEAINIESQETKSYKSQIIGGWYPMFFTDFDKDNLDNILSNQNIKKIVLTFDYNNELANKISSYIKSRSPNITLLVEYEPNKDTLETKYNHDMVILNIYKK